jgi:predicted metal-dependent enzyme (double-stranded beta helix superfamily)
MPGFEVDQLISDLSDAIAETEPRRAIKDVLERAMADPSVVGDALRPTEGGIEVLHHADDLTVLHVVWAPGMTIYPHDHRMWAAIGIYAGREDNAFYRRPAPDATTLVESGGKRLVVGDAAVLGAETIHGVTSSPDVLTAAIHVYGGDFINVERSAWGPGERVERPNDIEETRRAFAAANDAWRRDG